MTFESIQRAQYSSLLLFGLLGMIQLRVYMHTHTHLSCVCIYIYNIHIYMFLKVGSLGSGT